MSTKGAGGISYMHFLPCLRCGQDSVGVSLLAGAARRENVWCLSKTCEAVHYLRVAPYAGGLDVAYDRYTQGGELEAYEAGGVPSPGSRRRPSQDEGFSGPVAVYPPKRRFSGAEARAAWAASRGRCHLCGRAWSADERGGTGWRVDHVIPNAGPAVGEGAGGYRVACAECLPGRGRRGRRARLLRSVRDLVMRLTPSRRGAPQEAAPRARSARRGRQRRSSSR